MASLAWVASTAGTRGHRGPIVVRNVLPPRARTLDELPTLTRASSDPGERDAVSPGAPARAEGRAEAEREAPSIVVRVVEQATGEPLAGHDLIVVPGPWSASLGPNGFLREPLVDGQVCFALPRDSGVRLEDFVGISVRESGGTYDLFTWTLPLEREIRLEIPPVTLLRGTIVVAGIEDLTGWSIRLDRIVFGSFANRRYLGSSALDERRRFSVSTRGGDLAGPAVVSVHGPGAQLVAEQHCRLEDLAGDAGVEVDVGEIGISRMRVDDRDGQPIAGAVIAGRAELGVVWQCATDELGLATVLTPAAAAELHAGATGYSPRVTRELLPASLSFVLERAREAEPLRGRVVDHARNPVPGAVVQAYSAEGDRHLGLITSTERRVTDDLGRFSIPVPDAVPIGLRAFHPKLGGTWDMTVFPRPGQAVEIVIEGQGGVEVALGLDWDECLPAFTELRVLLVDRERDWEWTTSWSRPPFVQEELPSGRYHLFLYAPQLRSLGWANLEIRRGEITPVEVDLELGYEWIGRIQGEVPESTRLRAESGLPDAAVRHFCSAEPGPDGAFALFAGLQPSGEIVLTGRGGRTLARRCVGSRPGEIEITLASPAKE